MQASLSGDVGQSNMSFVSLCNVENMKPLGEGDVDSKTTCHRLAIFKERANVENTLKCFRTYVPSIIL